MNQFYVGVVVGAAVVLLAPRAWAYVSSLPAVAAVVSKVKGLFAPKA